MLRLLQATVCLMLALHAGIAQSGELTVDCRGAGERVYLIGGGPAFTTWNLQPIQQRLARSYRVCRWDMRGVGTNAKLVIDADTPLLTQWIRDMAEALPREPVVLWGHSWGALQALLFTRQHPERVRALVLNNPVDPALLSIANIESRRYVHPFVESHLDINDIDTPAEQRHRFRSKIASYFMDAVTGWEYSARFGAKDTNNALNVRIWQEYRRNPLSEPDMESLAAAIAGLIYCRQDVLMPESLQEYSRFAPAGKNHVLDGCAHFPWIESPEKFYKMLFRVLDAIE